MTENENPFLIPPPPRAEDRSDDTESRPETDLAAPLITLPPGLVDSATHRVGTRITRPRSPADSEPVRRSTDDIVFFPAPPGASAAPVATTPATVQPNPASSPASEATAIRPTGSAASWRLTLPSGDSVLLAGTTFIGRNPSVTAGWPEADLLPVSDPAKSVSKTHALLEIVDGRLWVHDLDSTNGVWLVVPGSDDTRVPPRARVAVPPGADLELGEFTVQIEHSGR